MCGTSIGSTSLVVEIVTAILFVACVARFDDVTTLVAHWVLCTGLMTLAVIDLFTMKLPRRIIHTTAAAGLPLLLGASLVTDDLWRMSTAIIGASGAFVAMGLLYIMSAGKLGDGDVRMSPLLGLYLGWKEVSAVFSGFFLSFLLGAVVGLTIMIIRPAGSSREIPFGPFLAFGTVAALLFDVDFLGWS